MILFQYVLHAIFQKECINILDAKIPFKRVICESRTTFWWKKKKEKKKNLDYITHCNKFFHENCKLTQFILQAFKLQQNHNSGGIGLKFPWPNYITQISGGGCSLDNGRNQDDAWCRCRTLLINPYMIVKRDTNLYCPEERVVWVRTHL